MVEPPSSWPATSPRRTSPATGAGRSRPTARCRTASRAPPCSPTSPASRPLTEALANELGSERGSEELTANLGRVFHAVIEELDRRGGDVIYFSGDAITCWLDGDDGTRATAAGLAMQEAMARVGRITTPAGTEVQLALKVAVAVGGRGGSSSATPRSS